MLDNCRDAVAGRARADSCFLAARVATNGYIGSMAVSGAYVVNYGSNGAANLGVHRVSNGYGV